MSETGFTLLETVGRGKYVAKTYTRDWATGEIRADEWDNIKTWSGREIAVSGIQDLHQWLGKISANPKACIVRGRIIDGTDASRMSRRKNPAFDPKTGEATEPATLEDCPRSWVMLDCDGALPEGADETFIPSNPDGALELIVESLPEAFREASFVYSWGNSAGVKLKKKPKLSAHLFFWISRAVPDTVLHLWAMRLKKAGSSIDPALFNPIQVHYVAAPRFLGDITDPLAGRRWGFRQGTVDVVDVDLLGLPGESEPEAERERRVRDQVKAHGLSGTNDGFFGHLRAIGGPLGFHQPVKSAVGAYIKHHGAEGTDVNALVELLRERILDADDGGRGPDEIKRYASEDFLLPLIRNIKLAHTAPRPLGNGPYRIEHGRICYVKEGGDGLSVVPLANFHCKIVGEASYDDGAGDTSRNLEIEGGLDTGKPLPRTVVTASEFPSVARWVLKAWGGRATVAAGSSLADKLREAIQRLSDDYPERIVYRHTGWRRIGGAWCFLHAGGAVTAEGQRTDIEVGLEERFGMYQLPDPEPLESCADSVRTVVDVFRAVTRPELTLPLLAAVVRAPLNEVMGVQDAVYGLGGTGIGKSVLFALAQAFFGPGFASRGVDPAVFPGSWSSSENALESEASRAKDVVFTIDDWVVDAHSTRDVLFRKASRVLRDAANNAGRATLNSDRTARRVYRSRALICTTAEDVPPGQSFRARATFLQIERGDIGIDRRNADRHRALHAAQQAAREGLFARVMATYLRWMAPRIDQLREAAPRRAVEIREGLALGASHARTPTAVASLLTGLSVFGEFCREAGAFSETEVQGLLNEARAAFAEVVKRQEPLLRAADPVERFGGLLLAVLQSGRAHLRDIKTDGRPGDAAAYGWQARAVLVDGTSVWDPQGPHIGWIDGPTGQFFLDPEATYASIVKLSGDQGSPFPITAQRLWTALWERNLIVSRDYPHYTTKRRVGDRRPRGLLLSGEVGQVGPRSEEPAPGAGETRPHIDENGGASVGPGPSNVGQAAREAGPAAGQADSRPHFQTPRPHGDSTSQGAKNPHQKRAKTPGPTCPTYTEQIPLPENGDDLVKDDGVIV